ncbi:MAG: ATP-binding cassette domain-containing protein [Bacillota bacterium]|nr:ATP-binding cassette domain-containing protein [Bacillota bacterium]
MNKEILFEVKDVKVWFPIRKGFPKKTVGYVKAVDGVSLNVYKGETLGIVGESGCGKTTLGKAMMLLTTPTSGQVLYRYGDEYKDIVKFDRDEVLQFRKKVQMIFQDPYSAMNPMKKIYTALEEPLKIHKVKSKSERERIMSESLGLVNIPNEYLFKYPHEFSGGQRQRVCIARALQINPEVLVCDEAVSALDVSIQAQVLNLMKKIQKERSLTYVFIAHDLSVVQYMSDRIAVMYLGKVVELASSRALYNQTLHPYSQSLLSAVPLPVLDQKKKRIILKGDVPSPINKPSGCAFHQRCVYCMDICKKVDPPLLKQGDEEHYVACHLYTQEAKDEVQTEPLQKDA